MSDQLSMDALLVDPLADAIAWRDANPQAYRQIVAWAEEDIANGARPAIDLYANLLRRPHFARRLGLIRSDDVYVVNNNLRSSIARLVMRENAGIRFEIRRSSYDEISAPNASPASPAR